MTRYRSGMWAPQGFYLAPGTWEIRAIPRSGGILEGRDGSPFIRIPAPPILMPFLGVLLGGLYIVLLPLIATAFLLWLLAVKVWKALLAATVRLVKREREV